MQNSNLSKLLPILKRDWTLFIDTIEKDVEETISSLNKDLRRTKELNRIINKIDDIVASCDDNIINILDHRDLFLYVDNTLDESFAALMFFKEKNNLDNYAVRQIYEKITNSPKIVKMQDEYKNLSIKVQFIRDRIKKIQNLLRGNNIDFSLVEDLVKKYDFDEKTKKNIMFYLITTLGVKQKEVKEEEKLVSEEIVDNPELFKEEFRKITQKYQNKKEELRDILVKCFSIRQKMTREEYLTYCGFINDQEELLKESFNEDEILKIYTIGFFKTKKDIENLINGIADYSIEDINKYKEEVLFIEEEIVELEDFADKIKKYLNVEQKNEKIQEDYNVFFLIDGLNRLVIPKELIEDNRRNVETIIRKSSNMDNADIDGVRTNRMLGVSDSERLIGKNISMITTSKLILSYITVGKNILIITGTKVTDDTIKNNTVSAINRNFMAIKRQIAYIEDNDLDYLDLQNQIIKNILEEEKVKHI